MAQCLGQYKWLSAPNVLQSCAAAQRKPDCLELVLIEKIKLKTKLTPHTQTQPASYQTLLQIHLAFLNLTRPSGLASSNKTHKYYKHVLQEFKSYFHSQLSPFSDPVL